MFGDETTYYSSWCVVLHDVRTMEGIVPIVFQDPEQLLQYVNDHYDDTDLRYLCGVSTYMENIHGKMHTNTNYRSFLMVDGEIDMIATNTVTVPEVS